MEEKLIETVRGTVFLYNTSHQYYMTNKLKLQIWEEVVKEVGMKCGSFYSKLNNKSFVVIRALILNFTVTCGINVHSPYA